MTNEEYEKEKEIYLNFMQTEEIRNLIASKEAAAAAMEKERKNNPKENDPEEIAAMEKILSSFMTKIGNTWYDNKYFERPHLYNTHIRPLFESKDDPYDFSRKEHGKRLKTG